MLSKFKLGDMFMNVDGSVFQYMKISSEGEPEKHANYPYRLESLRGLGFWDAYKTQEDAEEDIAVLIKDGTLKHYTNWSIILKGIDSSMKIVDRADLE